MAKIGKGSNRVNTIVRLFIEFDGCQVEVVTDIPEAREVFERAFRPMLVERSTALAGRIEFLSAADGYVINGLEKLKSKRRPLNEFIDYLNYDVVRQFMKARPDLLWLHAAAAERGGTAMLIAGPSGQGKSTLATHLCQRGWRLLSDDVAPIRMDADEVLPFPRLAFRRRYPGRAFPSEGAGFLVKEEVRLPGEALHRASATIGAVIFPVFKDGAEAELEPVSEGEAAVELLRNCSSFSLQKELAVARLARLAQSVPVYRLTYGPGNLDRFDVEKVFNQPIRG